MGGGGGGGGHELSIAPYIISIHYIISNPLFHSSVPNKINKHKVMESGSGQRIRMKGQKPYSEDACLVQGMCGKNNP